VVRGNFLGIWSQKAFEYEFFSTRLLSRTVYVCNSPDTIEQLFVERAASVERKIPEMRAAFAPLLGDALLVADGTAWEARRRILEPILGPARLADVAPITVEAADALAADWCRFPPGSRVDLFAAMAGLTRPDPLPAPVRSASGDDAAASAVEAALGAYYAAASRVDIAGLLGLPEWLPRRRDRAVGQAAAEFHRVLDGLIAQTLVVGGDALVHRLAQALDPKAPRFWGARFWGAPQRGGRAAGRRPRDHRDRARLDLVSPLRSARGGG